MVKPYVVKFVSKKSGVGKTRVACSIINILKRRGYIIGVVKHCSHGINIEDKDSHTYLMNNADIVIASSKELGVIYRSRWVDSLQQILNYIGTPIVIVEGFKGSVIGDTVVVAEDLEEALSLRSEHNIIAYIVKKLGSDVSSALENVYTLEDVERIANIIEEKALNYIHSQLPHLNCGYCGFSSCRELATAYAKGLAQDCPVRIGVKLIVNGRDIELNPFVKRLLKALILGFIEELKGVPKELKEVVVKIGEEPIG